jgi:hypothetical protein
VSAKGERDEDELPKLSKEEKAVYFKAYYEQHREQFLAWQQVYQAK